MSGFLVRVEKWGISINLKSIVGADEATDTPPDKLAATTDCVPIRK